ncbi:RagB/SusD family nutrient uptake outer membrane protein [Fibrivirga algicola]|uniref:RagB/SusD family nutrient uptake outer membrane protein n=1 Tax=Fibrivirga algicola TaxID=2950420 RepID=A0ABX0QIQ8_9BACT|nr:RagB/SusD family nutrient uptake outer membrane protein [Fibrivirga algicola]ARK10507.1 carbohydrate-binding protein SusD [Fibrella sp. ES10-3-2-2]NID12016.1 RagB/SusD family nutrient uptake outer membrane protein [Fibrivirga algicola]
MKKHLSFGTLLVLLTYLFSACHDVNVPVTTSLTPDIFPQNTSQFIQASGPPYAALRGNFSLDYWFMQSLSTDEAILPARGGNWYDNQGYRMLHYHDWTKDHGTTNSTWNWLSLVIGTTNQAMSILNSTIPATTPGKPMNLAELRMVRALAYFMMMDLYGNVPIDTTYGDFTPRSNVPRAQVFSFIEREVKASLPNLSRASGQAIYGRANKFTGFALLAKMYLNAEYYTGTQRYNDAVVACDSIINSGLYSIESRSTYLQMFYPNNGPQMKEFIFAIPYDPAAGALPGTNSNMYHARYDVPRSHTKRFGLPFTPSAPRSTLPEFYAYFKDPNDIRNNQWLTGPQFLADGVTPLTVTTTKKGYDQTYTGSDGAAPYTYQVNLTPEVILRQDVATYDLGNDEIAWNMGYRNIKFYPDASSTSRNQNNDVPLFRYSDIILMKAEAILRGGTATLGQTALSLVNQLRVNRTTSPALTSVNLEDLYAERCREFTWETWHRNDMIRFGKFEGKWGFKTDASAYRRIFPIPTGAFTVNPALVQNPGY